jgi:hypothetical protein
MLLAAGLLGALPAPSHARDEAIHFREAWGWAIVLPVVVGEAGIHELLLDTGATFTVLEPGLAAALGITAAGDATRATLTGEQPVSMGRVDLAIGGSFLDGVEVLIADLPAIRSDEPRVRGLLGQSALSRLEYTIDHARRRLIVHGAQAAPAQSVQALRPILDARLGCGNASSRFVLDSGVDTPVLFERAGRPLEVERGGLVRARSNGGEAVWREGRLPSLCVAGRRSGPVPVVVRPEATPARDEDGLLPSRFFARVRIGWSGVVIAVEPW